MLITVNFNFINKRATNALNTLEAGIDEIKHLSSKFGPNKVWTNPSLTLWDKNGIIDDIYDGIQLQTKSVI